MVDEFDTVSNVLTTRNLLSKKTKKSHLLLSHKRMNRYLLDVGLCKHKKIVGGDYSVFRAYEAPKLNILGLNSRVKWEKLTSVCDREPLIELSKLIRFSTKRLLNTEFDKIITIN